MGTEKRERQKANRKIRQEEERRLRQQRELRRRLTFIGGTVAVVFLALFLVYLTGRGDDADTTTDASNDTSGETTGTPDADTDDASSADDETPLTIPPADCPAEDGSSERETAFAVAPPMCIDPTLTYTAEVETNLGSFTIELDAERAPQTVNNFVFLSRYHYYEGVSFHRIIPGFVIQGGDAVGNPPGTGGPGYAIDDELPQAGEYQIGSVAMANSGPNTNGSQFFVITGDNGVALPPSYSLFGEVTAGMDTVSAIEALPTDANDAPTEEITISSVTITEG